MSLDAKLKCNRCLKILEIPFGFPIYNGSVDVDSPYFKARSSFGWASRFDTQEYDIDLCDDCYEDFTKWVENK